MSYTHIVQYNGFTRYFSSLSAARKFAKDIRGGGCCPVVKAVSGGA